jgi:hypothetical protein
MSKGLGIDQKEVYWSIDIDITKLASGISSLYKCILVRCGGDTPPNSLKDSNANPKVKTMERVGICSLTHNTLGVRRVC